MPLQNDPIAYMYTDSKLPQHFCKNCTKDQSLKLWDILLCVYDNFYVLQYVPHYSSGLLHILFVHTIEHKQPLS